MSLGSASAEAQALPGYDNTQSWNRSKIGENHWRLVGGVELEEGDTKIYADEAELFLDENRAVATGNVLFTQGANRIASDRADFNTATRLGTFYNARGIANIQPPKQRARPGGAAPPPIAPGQDNDVYFFGEMIEKIGPKKYKITNGGFSTCVQPTPRWSLSANSVVLNIDHYTLLKNAMLDVKGVPLFYTPFLYYPTKKEGRATGFLIPTYGTSTLRGQQIHNAFFWAINRSQDATISHEFDSKVGQGLGGEYRYNYGGANLGNLTANFLDQHDAEYVQSDGSTSTTPGSRSFSLNGGMNQELPAKFRARANISYFSSIVTNQTYNLNINDASRNNRTIGGNIVGGFNGYTLNATFDRTEYFYDTTDSALTGSAPRINFSRNEKPLFGSDLYFSATGEFVDILRENRTAGTSVNTGLARLDFMPTIRYPFKKWQWFTVNSSVSWRDTFYTRSYDPASVAPDPTTGFPTGSPVVADDSLNRRYFTATSQITGPVFNRIWDTPDNGYAEKFKHTIEPVFSVSKTSNFDNYNEIIPLEGVDTIVPGTTQLSWGVNNRFYAKKRSTTGAPGIPREIVTVSLSQTYYSDARSSLVDMQYSTSFTGGAPSNFSPIALTVRAAPTNEISGTLNTEFDSRYHSLRTMTTNVSYLWTSRVQTSASWTKTFLIPELAGFNDPTRLTQYLSLSSNVHTQDNRLGGLYSLSYDILNAYAQNQRWSMFYNSQCCGISFEYQSYNYGQTSLVPIAADHRFFLSFTLAGLGNFSPLNGANGQPH